MTDSYFIEADMNGLNLPVVTQEGGVAELNILAPELLRLREMICWLREAPAPLVHAAWVAAVFAFCNLSSLIWGGHLKQRPPHTTCFGQSGSKA